MSCAGMIWMRGKMQSSKFSKAWFACGLLPVSVAFGAPAYTVTKLTVCASAEPVHINNAGLIVGEGSNQAASYSAADGTTTYLGTLPTGTYSRAYAVSENGLIVGFSYVYDHGQAGHAAMFSGGTVTD